MKLWRADFGYKPTLTEVEAVGMTKYEVELVDTTRPGSTYFRQREGAYERYMEDKQDAKAWLVAFYLTRADKAREQERRALKYIEIAKKL